MSRYLSLLFVLITATSCTTNWFGRHNVIHIESEEVSRVIITYSEKLHYEKNLDLEDSVIAYGNKINRIRLDYSCMDALDVWEARKLLVDVVEEFLNRINANKIIAPDLARPLTANDLEIYIRFISFYNRYVDLETVGLISLRNGISTFFASDAFDCRGENDCWHHRSEYYFQTLSFVNSKRQGEILYKPKETIQAETSSLKKERYFPAVSTTPK